MWGGAPHRGTSEMARTKADPTRRTLVDIKNGVDKTGGASKAGGEKKKYLAMLSYT